MNRRAFPTSDQCCPHDGRLCTHACHGNEACLRQALGCQSTPEEGFPVHGQTPVREEPWVFDSSSLKH